MTLRQIVDKTGVPVKIKCTMPGVIPFTIIEDHKDYFMVKYSDESVARKVTSLKHMDDYLEDN